MSDFKLYLSDVGMFTMQSGIAAQAIFSPLETENLFIGALAENYVAQAFVANQIPLYYWKNNNTAEIDFVIQRGTDVDTALAYSLFWLNEIVRFVGTHGAINIKRIAMSKA